MTVFGDDSWMNGCMDSCFVVKEDGTKVQFDGLVTAQFVDNPESDGEFDPVIARIPRELSCGMEIKQTHKQARQTRKFFKCLRNNLKRDIRSHKRIIEKARRNQLKGKPNEYIYKMVRRSKYWYILSRQLEKALQISDSEYHAS